MSPCASLLGEESKMLTNIRPASLYTRRVEKRLYNIFVI